MFKACSKCGKIHNRNYKCYVGREIYNKDTEQNRLRATTKWRKKSEQIREDSNYLCAICLEDGVFNYNTIEVHHIIPLVEDKSLLLDDTNLICLCKKHHTDAENNKIKREYLKELAIKRINKSNPPL